MAAWNSSEDWKLQWVQKNLLTLAVIFFFVQEHRHPNTVAWFSAALLGLVRIDDLPYDLLAL